MRRACTMVVMLLMWPTLSGIPATSLGTTRCTERREATLPCGSSYSHSHSPSSQKGEASMSTPLASPDEPEETRKSSETNAEDQQHEQSEANPEHCLPVAGCDRSPLLPEARPPRKARFVWYTECIAGRVSRPTISAAAPWDGGGPSSRLKPPSCNFLSSCATNWESSRSTTGTTTSTSRKARLTGRTRICSSPRTPM